ncbi:MAG: hypothetical protein R3E79_39130 [Caldilineaceae bacterium]
MKPYTTDFDPPAPLIEVMISNVLNRRLRHTFPALLDTGPDVTAIPEICFHALKLYAIAEIQFEDVQANLINAEIYAVKFMINKFVIPRQEVVLTGLDFVIIGRDVLKHFNLHLYGREQMFELVVI